MSSGLGKCVVLWGASHTHLEERERGESGAYCEGDVQGSHQAKGQAPAQKQCRKAQDGFARVNRGSAQEGFATTLTLPEVGV